MSSSGDGRHSLKCALGPPSAVESSQSKPPLSDSEEDVPFQVARGPRWMDGPSVLALLPLPAPSSLDLVGPLDVVSTMIRMDALRL